MLDLDLSGLFRGGGGGADAPTIEILTVCTGNICRSPLAEQVLRSRLGDLNVSVASAGTHALVDEPMTPDAARLAASLGVPADDSRAHRARWLTDRHLSRVDLVLAMTREHRTHVVELAPARTRSTFTAREFARLAAGVTDADIRRAAHAAGSDPHARVRAALALLGARRGEIDALAHPAEDDVIDPYRRSWRVYEQSAAEMTPGLEAVARVLRAALT
jgi:protein-tyrosine phosphatase